MKLGSVLLIAVFMFCFFFSLMQVVELCLFVPDLTLRTTQQRLNLYLLSFQTSENKNKDFVSPLSVSVFLRNIRKSKLCSG